MTLSYFQNYFVRIYVLTHFFFPKCFDFCHSCVLVKDNGHSNIKRACDWSRISCKPENGNQSGKQHLDVWPRNCHLSLWSSTATVLHININLCVGHWALSRPLAPASVHPFVLCGGLALHISHDTAWPPVSLLGRPRALPACPCHLPAEALSTTASLPTTSSCPFIGKGWFFKTYVLSWRFIEKRAKTRCLLCSWWRAFRRTSRKQGDEVLVLFLAPSHPSLLYLFSPISSSLECHCASEWIWWQGGSPVGPAPDRAAGGDPGGLPALSRVAEHPHFRKSPCLSVLPFWAGFCCFRGVCSVARRPGITGLGTFLWETECRKNWRRPSGCKGPRTRWGLTHSTSHSLIDAVPMSGMHLRCHPILVSGELELLQEDAMKGGALGFSRLVSHSLSEIPEDTFLSKTFREVPSHVGSVSSRPPSQVSTGAEIRYEAQWTWARHLSHMAQHTAGTLAW